MCMYWEEMIDVAAKFSTSGDIHSMSGCCAGVQSLTPKEDSLV